MSNLHAIPVGGDEPIHYANAECWCYPVPDTEEPTLLVHNAKDCREARERLRPQCTGRKHEGKEVWVLIGQEISKL